MKIVVTTTEPVLDAEVDPRFGRCRYFLSVDTETMECESIENSNAALGGGAGIQSAQQIAEKGIKYVLTGNCGPNAYQTLSAAGISVITGCSGIARDIVEQFRAGQFNVANEPNVASHFGTALAPNSPQGQPAPSQRSMMSGSSMGKGVGVGMGRGLGRGMGRGRGMGMNAGFMEAAAEELPHGAWAYRFF